MSCNKWYGPYIGARTHGRDHPFQPFIRHVSLVIPRTHVGPSAHCQLDRAEVIVKVGPINERYPRRVEQLGVSAGDFGKSDRM